MKLPVFDVANSPKHYPATDLETVDESEFKSKKQRERERESRADAADSKGTPSYKCIVGSRNVCIISSTCNALLVASWSKSWKASGASRTTMKKIEGDSSIDKQFNSCCSINLP